MEKTLCYSELSGHTSRPDIKKSKSHALFSLLNPWSNEGCFFVTPFPGSAGGSVQPFFGQTAASLSYKDICCRVNDDDEINISI